MIKIHDKLWYVCKTDSETSLAYMTYYKKDKAFDKRKSTGLGWATKTVWTNDGTGKYYNKPVDTPDENVVDNEPITGFKIGDSVSRWSTQNKLFRITDPRGFTVEVPTGNIGTLLQHTTVINGVIQQPCLWGRDGSNHVLLSVLSEPYAEALEKLKALSTANKNIIPYNKLTPNSWVKILTSEGEVSSGSEYYYIGRVKITWRSKQTGREIQDKFDHTFIERYTYITGEESFSFSSPQKPKVVDTLLEQIDVPYDKIKGYYAPTRIKNQWMESDICTRLPNGKYRIEHSGNTYISKVEGKDGTVLYSRSPIN